MSFGRIGLARRALVVGGAAAAVAGAWACGQDITPPPVRNLDRPSAVAFACYGMVRVNGGDPEAAGEETVSAQSLASCRAHAGGEPPPGQEDLISTPRVFGFVLQSTRGTVAVIDLEAESVQDSDPLTPGKNAIPIGTLPVGLVTDRSGCHLVAANAGSCDLGVLDVTSALDLRAAAIISRVAITTPAGELVRARPRTLLAGAQDDTIGVACPERPTGLVYVAYPACHVVAVVNAGTGEVRAGIELGEDGAATITDGEIDCPSECSDGAIVPPTAELGGMIDAGPVNGGPGGDAGPDAGPTPDGGPPTTDDSAPRPIALHRAPDGRLVIGSENSPIVTTVELDADGMPTATSAIQLEGAVGVTSLAVSEPIDMGGELGTLGGSAGEFSFMYAVATDRTIRVVNVGRMVECDTQVDPRFLYDERDVALLSCLPVGGPDTPPRRAAARGPGIQLPRDAVPLDVAFATVNSGIDPGPPSPGALVGTFAFVTSSDGFVYVVSVDDDNYPDFEDPDDPARAAMPLALAHQLRDFVGGRDAIASNCVYPAPEPLELGPRVAEPPVTLLSEERVALEKIGALPSIRQARCTAGDDEAPVSELGFGAPIEVREQTFADWRSVVNERWTITWEGALSLDGPSVVVNGPQVRGGQVEVVADGRMDLHDPASGFCALGAEPYDVVQLIGCDPVAGDAQCGLGETCYVHPDSPTVVPTGVCLPIDRADVLSGPCRDFLTTRRQYSVRESHADRLLLSPRRRVLRTTPVAGCDSDAQCVEMARVEADLSDPDHPVDISSTDPALDWVCENDPSRAPGPARCQVSCAGPQDCEAGQACLNRFCVEGIVPPEECLATTQRYQVRAGDAFTVIGERTGYLHGIVRDPDTGECMADPDADPLLVGRVPLVAPPCAGDGFGDVSPNPCSVEVEQTEVYTPFEADGDRCVTGAARLRTRDVAAVRLTNPAFRFHLVNLTSTGDRVCTGDGEGDLPPFAAVYQGYQLSFQIIGGFFGMFATPIEAAYPVEITPAPDGRLWVLDAGDATTSTQGRVYTMSPAAGNDGFAVAVIL